MLQKTYSIYSENPDTCQLYIEAGKNHIACWCKDQEENKLTTFELFQCDGYAGSSFESVIDAARLQSALLARKFEKTKFILNTDEAICIPHNSSQADDNFINQNFELLFGPCAEADIFSEAHGEYLFASRIDKDVYNSARTFFPGVQIHSQYACLLPALIANGNADIVYLYFYPRYFSLIAFKGNKLQVLQTRCYAAAEDVLYFVLNVFQQYNISRETEISTGGFIDEESKLYQTLYQYLEGLKPAQLDEALFAAGAFTNYSSHYFLPYANYVL